MIKPIRILIAVAALAGALAAGLYLGGHPGDLPDPLRDAFVDENAALPSDAADLIEDNYAKRVSASRLRDGALRGMVDSLDDRFSHYFSPRENALFRESVGGEFSGVGMTVVQHPRGLLVTGVYKDTPAARAKIRPGQVITAVNGKSIAGESSDLATARIKGKAGTFVSITVGDRKGRRQRVLRLRRERIKVPVVAGKLRRVGGKRLGVVAIASFVNGVHGELRGELSRLRKRGGQGFVVDLRQNGGGLLDEAVLVASLFVPEGVIVSTKGRTRPRRVLRATGGAIVRQPVVVLIDRGTASASEIVTAALKERVGAKVVGRRTFGKGVFGQIFDLPNNGALDLTLGNYYTPNGENLGGKGIRPDVHVADDPDSRRDEALERALTVLASEVGGEPRHG
jgi:carboxyl-terminal processing protease